MNSFLYRVSRDRSTLIIAVIGLLLLCISTQNWIAYRFSDTALFTPHLVDKLGEYMFSLGEIILRFLLFVVGGWGVFKINETFSLSHSRSNLPFFFFVLLFGFNPALQLGSGPALIILLFIPAIFILFDSYQKQNTVEQGLIIGIIIGILSLFLVKVLFFIPIFILGFWFMRSLSFKTFLSILVGIISLFWIQFCWYFYTDQIDLFINQFVDLNNFSLPDLLIYPTGILINNAICFLITFIASCYTMVSNFNEKVKTQACYNFLILLCLASLFLVIFDSVQISTSLSILYIGSAFIIANFFTKVQTKVSSLLFFIIIATQLVSYGLMLWNN